MRLAIFNGSPRTKKSNTGILLSDLIKGFSSTEADTIESYYLNSDSRRKEAAKAFQESDLVILAFPLYVHAMPAIVMTWLEMLEPISPEKQVKMGFIVQSGLPEPRQSRAVEAFLKKLPKKLGCDFIGSAVRGDVEMMRFAPAFMFRSMHRAFEDLGKQLATKGEFDQGTVNKLAGPEIIPSWRQNIFRLFKAVGLADKYWVDTLKKNNALDRCFDAPYTGETSDN